MTQPAGWYHDHDGTMRYWDGHMWTEHTTAAPGTLSHPQGAQGAQGAPNVAYYQQQVVVIHGEKKSVIAAFFLAFLLGPIGLLYATIAGGIIMIAISMILGTLFITATLGLAGWPIWVAAVWLISIIWAVIAATVKKGNHPAITAVNR